MKDANISQNLTPATKVSCATLQYIRLIVLTLQLHVH